MSRDLKGEERGSHWASEGRASGSGNVLSVNVPDGIKKQRGGQAGGVETWGLREEAGFYLSDMARQEDHELERDGARSSSLAPSGCR